MTRQCVKECNKKLFEWFISVERFSAKFKCAPTNAIKYYHLEYPLWCWSISFKKLSIFCCFIQSSFVSYHFKISIVDRCNHWTPSLPNTLKTSYWPLNRQFYWIPRRKLPFQMRVGHKVVLITVKLFLWNSILKLVCTKEKFHVV